MKDSSTIHEVTYVISIRSEYRQAGSPIFRGALETVAGQKFEFNTLAELNGLLCEICGWIDTPPLPNEVRETT
jgi:hypothetical protein